MPSINQSQSALSAQLNPPQQQAVEYPNQPLLVLAGAGSGKTRVLVHRISWWIAQGIAPHSLLAVTFTNKAAAEMRGRVESMLKRPVDSLWLGTFHGLAHRLLRLHWQDAGLSEAFQIIDSEDQLRVIRRLMKELQVDEKTAAPKQIQWFINQQKDDGLRAHQVKVKSDPYSTTLLEVYRAYESYCKRSGLVDFAELLLSAYELWKNKPAILKHYQQRFHHVLVDEFQDTNRIQYLWLKALTAGKGNITIVGDDDQSIYGWRGARVENIQTFHDDFVGTETILLEQNYRSTGNILDAANALISHNFGRLGKKLWTSDDKGDPIRIYQAFNEQEEARFIASRIEDWHQKHQKYSETAILYRSNAQSRVLEEALLAQQIPYRIYGGLRFFDRAEIKNALAYLRLSENPADDSAFERIVNTPTRGIGEKTLQTVRQLARDEAISLWESSLLLCQQKRLTNRAAKALGNFIELMVEFQSAPDKADLHPQMRRIIDGVGLMENYMREPADKWESRKENIQELLAACSEFDPDSSSFSEGLSATQTFLSHAALESGEQQASEHQDSVQLMTMHSAKGLEFPLVFISGMEENLFPHKMSMDDADGIEEERRLAYVGITRARQNLILTWSEKRRLWGNEQYQHQSRFIDEIPKECREDVRLNATISRPMSYARSSTETPGGFHLGQTVNHQKFGDGIILNFEGEGDQARIQVNFEQSGSKWLVLGYANLQSI
jgi:DNA helicase-2/ATP-dependent DNA helicase PcrA